MTDKKKLDWKQNTLHYFTVFWQYVTYIIRQFISDNCFESASALTYTTLLSIVPFLAITVFIMQGIPYFQDLWGDTQQFIFSHFLPSTGRELENYLQEFVNNTGQLSIIGVIFLIFSAMVLIYTIEQTFNRIWSVKSKRGIVNSFLLYWAVLTLMPILMGLSFGFSSYVWSLQLWQTTAEQLGITSVVVMVVTFCMSWFCFTIMYIIIPNVRVKWKHALCCALFVAIVFEIFKKLFASYVASINMNTLLYGAFATIPMFLLWIYVLWIIILVGAEMISALAYYNFTAITTSEGRFVQAYKWMVILWEAQREGHELSAEELFKREGKLTANEPFAQLSELESSNWIKKTQDDKYVLARDLSVVTLYDFYNSLPWKLPNADNVKSTHDKYVKILVSQLKEVDTLLINTLSESLLENFKSIKV